MFKVATWNVNSLRVRLPQVLTWLAEHQPDVLALQEIKMPTEDFPLAAFAEAGYQAVVSGQRTYNGVAILCRDTGKDTVTDLPNLEDPQRRVLAVTVAGVRILNLYIPNGESVESTKYVYKLDWLHKLDGYLKQELKTHKQFVVLGDFNIAPEDQDVHNPDLWHGKVLFSDPERAAFRAMVKLGLQDCFRLQSQPEKSFTWWDYRMNAFKRNLGLRIDHILASPELAARCVGCHIDKVPRTNERPSDHAPVIAEFSL